MKHIIPFPLPDAPEHAADREALRTKLMAGRLVQTKTWSVVAIQAWMHYPCWHYAGKWTDGKGYKKIKYKGHTIYVHRASVELFKGPIPDGHLVDHLCKDHGCWQPEHLEPVPTKVNIERGDNPNWLLRNAEKSGVIAADLAEVGGKLGDQPVTITTPRPAFWSNPELVQAHIDHEHPRFRKPMAAVDFLDPMDLTAVNQHRRLTSIPDDHVIVRREVNQVDIAGYVFPDCPAIPVHEAAFDDSELTTRRRIRASDLWSDIRAWWHRLRGSP